jgi:hypothetical protein
LKNMLYLISLASICEKKLAKMNISKFKQKWDSFSLFLTFLKR